GGIRVEMRPDKAIENRYCWASMIAPAAWYEGVVSCSRFELPGSCQKIANIARVNFPSCFMDLHAEWDIILNVPEGNKFPSHCARAGNFATFFATRCPLP